MALALAAAAVVVSLPAGNAGASFACAASGVARYEVRSGDGWLGIAARLEIGVGSLLDANDAELADSLHPGDQLCLPAGASLNGACAPGGASYTVRSGDGWYVIAQRAGVSARSLLDANGAGAELALHPGDVLCLPPGASAPAPSSGSSSGSSSGASRGGSYTVASGDSWFGIARRAGVSARALLAANGASTSTALHPGDTLTLPAGASVPTGGGAVGSGSYTVASGDSWFGIAARAGVTGRALLAANGATSSTPLHPGDELVLPAGADAGALRRTATPTVRLEALPTQGPCWYADTWLDPRSGGRRHVGVDYFTKRGEYVYAVVDGRLSGRAWDQPGRRAGNAWWLTAADGTASFFYAHLEDFAPGLEVGSRVRAGQIIGWVGKTGNASAVHLHFEIHPRGGDPINPYPIVHAQGGCNRGTPYTQPGGWVPERID